MREIVFTPTVLMAGLAVLSLVLTAWRSARRRARAAVDAARAGTRLASLSGRVLFTTGLIVAAQWVVVTHRPGNWLMLSALGVPALFASYTLTRALTVTTQDTPRRRGGGHR
jgi:hypothetical protein